MLQLFKQSTYPKQVPFVIKCDFRAQKFHLWPIIMNLMIFWPFFFRLLLFRFIANFEYKHQLRVKRKQKKGVKCVVVMQAIRLTNE